LISPITQYYKQYKHNLSVDLVILILYWWAVEGHREVIIDSNHQNQI